MEIDLAIPAYVDIYDNKPFINTTSTTLTESKVSSCWEEEERRSTLGSYVAPTPLVMGIDNLLYKHHGTIWTMEMPLITALIIEVTATIKRAKAWSGLLEKLKALLKFNL